MHHTRWVCRLCLLGGPVCIHVRQSHRRDDCSGRNVCRTTCFTVVSSSALERPMLLFLSHTIFYSFFANISYKPNGIVVAICLAFTAINAIAIFIDWFVFTPFIEYLSLFYGVFIGFYSVLDIYDDLVTRTAEGSDAVACHQVIPCCAPRCVGVQFWIVAFAFQVAGLYMALVWMVST
jgi:Peptidase M50B-like